MGISGDYPQPVQVNGYSCRNCTDVDNAKKNIDPAHPKSGPFGVDAASDPTRASGAVSFGGGLSGLNATAAAPQSVKGCGEPGSRLDVCA